MSSENLLAPSLTVVIPAYNEAEGLAGTYEAVNRALTIAGIVNYEILIVTDPRPDGSHDGTAEIAAQLAAVDPKVRHLPKSFFVGLGYKYREAIHEGTKDYLMFVPAHNLTEESSLVNIMLHVGQAEAIFTYTGNLEVRPPVARFVSRGYVVLCNLLFGLDVKYYNGISVVSRELLLKIPTLSNDHVAMAEIIVYLVRAGVKYLELPQLLKPSNRTGRVWNPENTFRVLGSLGSLFWRINIEEQRLEIAGATPLSTLSPGALLVGSSGTPDFGAVLGLVRQNFVQTVHPILVYLVKCVANALGLSAIKSDGTGQATEVGFNPDKLIGITRTLVALAGKIALRMALVGAGDLAGRNSIKKKKIWKKKDGSLSIVMPTYNEALRLPQTVDSATRALQKAGIGDYEIIVVTNTAPDGSHDGTLNVADGLAENIERVRHVRNESYAGMGVRYRQGVAAATKNYVMMLPGDGEFEEDSIAEVMKQLGKVEIIIPYIGNPQVRALERQLVSQGLVTLCNKLFGLNLKYYNGMCIIPRHYLEEVPANCEGYAYMIEILVHLLKSGARYREVPFKIKPSIGSKAFNAESVNEVFESLTSLFWKVNVEGVRVDL